MSNLAAKMRQVSESTVSAFTKKEVDSAIEQYHLFFIPTIEGKAMSGLFVAEFHVPNDRRFFTSKLKELLGNDGFIVSHVNDVLVVSW